MTAPGLAREARRALVPWNHSVGLAWADVLRACGLDTTGTVAEVGPGFTDKIAHGLAELRFSGTLLLIEPTASARAWACERYRTLLPAADVVGEPASIDDVTHWSDRAIDAVVSNHVLDDMLLHAAVEPAARDALFGEMRPGAPCLPAFVRAWADLVAEPGRLDKLVAGVADAFTRYVVATRPRVVALHQYPSWTHRRNGMAFIHAESLRVMRMLEARLLESGLRRLRAPVRLGRRGSTEWLLMSWPR